MSSEFYDASIVCTLVGTTNTGKTSMLSVYSKDLFPEEYTPTSIETETKLHQFKKKAVRVEIYDTGNKLIHDF